MRRTGRIVKKKVDRKIVKAKGKRRLKERDLKPASDEDINEDKNLGPKKVNEKENNENFNESPGVKLQVNEDLKPEKEDNWSLDNHKVDSLIDDFFPSRKPRSHKKVEELSPKRKVLEVNIEPSEIKMEEGGSTTLPPVKKKKVSYRNLVDSLLNNKEKT